MLISRKVQKPKLTWTVALWGDRKRAKRRKDDGVDEGLIEVVSRLGKKCENLRFLVVT